MAAWASRGGEESTKNSREISEKLAQLHATNSLICRLSLITVDKMVYKHSYPRFQWTRKGYLKM